MMQCFLCGSRYDEQNRFDGVGLARDGEEEPIRIQYITYDDHVLRLCPLCVQAAVFGNVLAGGDFHWIYGLGFEDYFEEQQNEEVLTQQAEPPEPVEFPLMMDDVPLEV